MDLEEFSDKSEQIAKLMKNLAHQKKLMILCNLIVGHKTVGELSELCEMGQSQTSQCLKRMELEGLLTSERDGNYIYYSILDERITLLIKQIKKIFC